MIYGAIFGDIAGSNYEFRPVRSNDFEITTGHFTDDTVMTLAVANWLTMKERTEENLIKSLQQFGHKYPKVGYGGTFRMWLVDADPQPYNSWGNGSAMRVSPCGWVANSLEEAEELAEISARVTHNHPEGIKGAQSVAAAIYLARTGHSKQYIKKYIEDKYGYNLDRTVQSIIDRGYRFDVSCQGSVPEAIIAFLDADDYESTVRNAIMLGGDADTQACIAGSIAEAFYELPIFAIITVKAKLDPFLRDTLNHFHDYVNTKKNSMKNWSYTITEGEHAGETLWSGRYCCVAGFILSHTNGDNVKVLAVQRGKGCPDEQGLWCCPCGFLEANESGEEGIARETLEETGYDFPAKLFDFYKVETEPELCNKAHVTLMYGIILNERDLSEPLELTDIDESSEVRWIPVDEISKYKWAFGHDKIINEIMENL